jgi:hypothetical protein
LVKEITPKKRPRPRGTGRRRALRPGQLLVGDDQLGEGAPARDLGQRRAYSARAYQEYAHVLILALARGDHQRDPSFFSFFTTEIVAK